LSKDTTSELTSLSSHYPVLMLNVKQGSCEYQFFKSFCLIQPGNRTYKWDFPLRWPSGELAYIDASGQILGWLIGHRIANGWLPLKHPFIAEIAWT